MTTPLTEALWEARRAHGLSQVALAKLCNITASHLCDIEMGRRLPSATLAALLGRALELGEDYLVLLSGRIPCDIVQAGFSLEKAKEAMLVLRAGVPVPLPFGTLEGE